MNNLERAIENLEYTVLSRATGNATREDVEKAKQGLRDLFAQRMKAEAEKEQER